MTSDHMLTPNMGVRNTARHESRVVLKEHADADYDALVIVKRGNEAVPDRLADDHVISQEEHRMEGKPQMNLKRISIEPR